MKDNPKKHKLRAVKPEPTVLTDAVGFVDQTHDLCEKCFGSGMEVIPGKGAQVCECRRRNSHTLRLSNARIPKRYEKCHFNTFDPRSNESQKTALRIARDFTNSYPAIDNGLLFSGPVGVGKTHLAVSIIKGLTERGFPCLFYEFGSLLKEIQDSYNPNTRTSELAVLSPVLTADVLVLDELGASKPTDWVLDTMAHIINSRYNDRRITIFTTNFPDERVDQAKETLEDRISVRVRSRIYEMCKSVRIEGQDFRRIYGRP